MNELRFLDPQVISGLGTMELKARTVVEGFLAGLHRSPYKGFSVEFAEYRPYMPGDDPVTIDWKVFARTDRYYVKKFEEETNLECRLLIDISASMGYRSSGVSKLEYGSCLAGALAYLVSRQRDAVGLISFDNQIHDYLPPSARPGHLRALLLALDRMRVGERTNVSKPLHQLAETMTKRGLVVLISDLLDEPDRVVDGLRHFRFLGTDVIVFHLLDPAELTFPFDRPARFQDVETNQEVLALPSVVRKEYLEQMDALVEFYRRELRVGGIDYCLVNTATPLEFALLSFLATRRRAY